MADPVGLTIDQLRELVAVESHLFFPLDSPNETFKVTLQSIVAYAREAINVTPTGSFIMWPGEIIPKGYIELAGQSFSVGSFPVLGSIFPSGKLPDTRNMMLKHGANGRDPLSFEADAIKSHGHTAAFSGSALPSHDHSMAHSHVHQKVVDFETSQTPGSTWPKSIEIPNDGWSARANTAGSSGAPISIRFNSEGRTTGGSSQASTGRAGAVKPSGSVTVNQSGSSKNLVDNIAVKFIVKQE